MMRQEMAAVFLACCACSEPAHRAAAGDATVVPSGLSVSALPGGNGVLKVTGLTLRRVDTRIEMIAALKNAGDVPACHAAFSVELFDAQQQSLAAGITGLLTQSFYRRTDGSGTIAACVAPGGRTMAAITDLPLELDVDGVRHVVYRCPYSALDVEPISGLEVGHVAPVAHGGRVAFAGILVNALDVRVDRPSVTVFTLDRAGRPLGFALSTADILVPPGGEWAFETSTLDAPGAEQLAFPAGALDTQ